MLASIRRQSIDAPAHVALALFMACLLGGQAGCSGDSGPQRTRVSGKVTHNGQPLSGGFIQFLPANPSAGSSSSGLRPATAPIGGDGSYTLGTFGAGDGVLPGEYKVAVNTRTSDISPEEPDAPQAWAAPEKYGDPNQSGLTATVPADGKAITLDFDLEG